MDFRTFIYLPILPNILMNLEELYKENKKLEKKLSSFVADTDLLENSVQAIFKSLQTQISKHTGYLESLRTKVVRENQENYVKLSSKMQHLIETLNFTKTGLSKGVKDLLQALLSLDQKLENGPYKQTFDKIQRERLIRRIVEEIKHRKENSLRNWVLLIMGELGIAVVVCWLFAQIAASFVL